MSTPALVKFEDDGAVYIHWDGMPESIIPDFQEFLREIRDNLDDTRFGDSAYLATKYVVWQARNFANGKHYLDFLSVGVCDPARDYGQCYTYRVTCNENIPLIEQERS